MPHVCTESSVDRRRGFTLKVLAGVGLFAIAISPIGCGKRQTQAKVPVPPPPISAPAAPVNRPPASTQPHIAPRAHDMDTTWNCKLVRS